MTESRRSADIVLPRRWWMIDEIDLARLIAEQEDLAGLCDMLEACADALPIRPAPESASQLCASLHELVAREAEGDTTFAALFGRDAGDVLTLALLDQSRRRRADDALHAQDLIAMLQADPSVCVASTDALGYMLRCFFNGCRAAMDIELLAILTLARHRLTSAARSLIVESIVRRWS
ncbi:hypothetical protein AB2M62_05305 [Sphingomonas sp. MMS12-HWE2-04]|uniref:hypothetical protein n=1 Tax=Sphingomonas sp. MMS12-HWE2-04 TaxID=3234199 RepID=UPI003850A171